MSYSSEFSAELAGPQRAPKPGHRSKSKRKINDRIDGTATDGFEELKFLFQRNFTNKLERNGAALAVYYKGKLVVDLWGGWADRTNNKDWAKETLANIFSCTKSLAAICMAMKVHSKECDYSDKVTKFWPEFGKNGKEDITIDMILTHRAGLPYFEEELTLEDGADRGKISKTIEEEAPKYPPGSKIAYHPITFGWLIDQVFSRIDSKHRTIGEFLRDEVQQKHNTEVFIGSCADQENKIAKLAPLRRTPGFREFMHDRKIFSVGNLLHPKAQPSTGAKQQPMGEGKGRGSKESIIIQSIEMFNSPLVRAFGQPAVNGVASARGLALVHQKFMDGTLVSQEFFKNLSKPQFEDYFDHTLGEEESKGYGFTYCKSPTGTWQIGHPGVGSQCVRMDPENDLVICYLTNAVKASHGKHSSSYSNLHDKIYEILAAKKKN